MSLSGFVNTTPNAVCTGATVALASARMYKILYLTCENKRYSSFISFYKAHPYWLGKTEGYPVVLMPGNVKPETKREKV